MTNYILIDGSYYIFYKYYALHAWWKLAKADESLEIPYENKDFVEKYKKTFVDKIKQISKKLKIKDAKIYVGKDCSKKDIWRTKFMEDYKLHRINNEKLNTKLPDKNFFKMAYDTLYSEAGAEKILYCDELEADDCIAITTKHIIEKEKDSKVWIIANDMDYLQLVNERISLYNMQFKCISTSKQSTGDAKKDLFCKIVLGDKSDYISGVFPKCSKMKALKYYDDREMFEKELNKNDKFVELYNRNNKIIDFNEIPQELVDKFLKTSLMV